MRITFRREEKETGLARVCQGTRGWDINVDGKRVGGVAPNSRHNATAWYWYISHGNHLGIPHANTCNSAVPTKEEAKASAKEWIMTHAGKAAE